MAKVRVNINISEEVKEWYQAEAERHGMAMSALMAYTLTSNYDNKKTVETFQDMNMLIREVKDDGGSTESNREMMEQLTQLVEMMKEGK